LTGARAHEVLDRIAALSEPFGTEMSISDQTDVGWVTL
jgi:hypothetical protein